MYSVFDYYSNNILFVFGHNSEPEYYSYSYSAKYFCTNIIRIRIRSFWKNEYYSYSYSVRILMPNIIRIRIRSKKQYSLTSVCNSSFWSQYSFFVSSKWCCQHWGFVTKGQRASQTMSKKKRDDLRYCSLVFSGKAWPSISPMSSRSQGWISPSVIIQPYVYLTGLAYSTTWLNIITSTNYAI